MMFIQILILIIIGISIFSYYLFDKNKKYKYQLNDIIKSFKKLNTGIDYIKQYKLYNEFLEDKISHAYYLSIGINKTVIVNNGIIPEDNFLKYERMFYETFTKICGTSYNTYVDIFGSEEAFMEYILIRFRAIKPNKGDEANG